MPVDIETLKKDVFAILVTIGKPATAQEINDEYREMFQSDISFAEFGYYTLSYLLQSHHFFDVLRQVDCDGDGRRRFAAKTVAHSVHIQRLVSGQRKKDDHEHHQNNKNLSWKDRFSTLFEGKTETSSFRPVSSTSSRRVPSNNSSVQPKPYSSKARTNGSSAPVSFTATFNSQPRPNGFTAINELNASKSNGTSSRHNRQQSSQAASKSKVQGDLISFSDPEPPVTGSLASSATTGVNSKCNLQRSSMVAVASKPRFEEPLIILSDCEYSSTDAKLKKMLTSNLSPLPAAEATEFGTACEPEGSGSSNNAATYSDQGDTDKRQ